MRVGCPSHRRIVITVPGRSAERQSRPSRHSTDSDSRGGMHNSRGDPPRALRRGYIDPSHVRYGCGMRGLFGFHCDVGLLALSIDIIHITAEILSLSITLILVLVIGTLSLQRRKNGALRGGQQCRRFRQL